jgi:hypothetical protein
VGVRKQAVLRLCRSELNKGTSQTFAVVMVLRIIAASSDGTGKDLNGLMFEPPVLPVGTRPKAVFVAAPTIRVTWPRHSRTF